VSAAAASAETASAGSGAIKTRASAINLLRDGRAPVWWKLRRSERPLVARVYLDTYGRRYHARVTPRALVAEVANDLRQDMLDYDPLLSGKKLLRVWLEFPASLAEAQAIFKAKSKLLPGRRLIGKTTAQVEKLIGSPKPKHTQSISGQVIWYYELGDNTYQLILLHGRVANQNKY
jgi:hypothetical protein